MTWTIGGRTLATLIAALRCYQDAQKDGGVSPAILDEATDSGRVEPLLIDQEVEQLVADFKEAR